MYRQVLVKTNLQTRKRVKKIVCLREVHYGGDGPRWTTVPSRNKKKEKRKKKVIMMMMMIRGGGGGFESIT